MVNGWAVGDLNGQFIDTAGNIEVGGDGQNNLRRVLFCATRLAK
jgi:hypothetical protein